MNDRQEKTRKLRIAAVRNKKTMRISSRNHGQARCILPITVSSIPGRKRIAVLRPHGSLYASTYRDLITEAKKLYDTGMRCILLDLCNTPYIGCSGLVALHNIAVMLQGEEAPDPEYGWQAIHALERGIGGDAEKRLKILKAQPQVAQLLQSPCFARFLDIYTDLDAAVASCRQPPPPHPSPNPPLDPPPVG